MDLGNVCVVDLVGFLWVLFCSWCLPPLSCRFLGDGGRGGSSPSTFENVWGREEMRPWQVTLRPLSLLCTVIRSHSYKPDFHEFRRVVQYSQSCHSPGKSDSSFAELRFFINKGCLFLYMTPSYFLHNIITSVHHWGVKRLLFNLVSEAEKQHEVGVEPGSFTWPGAYLVSYLNVYIRGGYQ